MPIPLGEIAFLRDNAGPVTDARYKSITTSPLGWEQQINRLPWAGGSRGTGW